VWSEGGGGGRESRVKGKQNDERKRFQKGNLSGWASEDIRGFNEMLVWEDSMQVAPTERRARTRSGNASE